MAKLILGEKPDVQVKSFMYTLTTEFITRTDPAELEALLEAKARAEQVPTEATLTMRYDTEIDASVYCWRWWEVTI